MTAYINKLKDVNSNQQLPVTHERAVRDDNGTTAETKFQNLEGAMDKAYVASSDNGMGRITLHKNMVSGVNTLTQSMMQATNTIYVIRYDFTLTDDVTIPENCILEFDGGSISGAYTITGNNTIILTNNNSILGDNITISGTWNNEKAISSWFDLTTDANSLIKNLAALSDIIILNNDREYNISKSNTNFSCKEIIGKNSILNFKVASDLNASGWIITGDNVHISGFSITENATESQANLMGNTIVVSNCDNLLAENISFTGTTVSSLIAASTVKSAYIKDMSFYDAIFGDHAVYFSTDIEAYNIENIKGNNIKVLGNGLFKFRSENMKTFIVSCIVIDELAGYLFGLNKNNSANLYTLFLVFNNIVINNTENRAIFANIDNATNYNISISDCCLKLNRVVTLFYGGSETPILPDNVVIMNCYFKDIHNSIPATKKRAIYNTSFDHTTDSYFYDDADGDLFIENVSYNYSNISWGGILIFNNNIKNITAENVITNVKGSLFTVNDTTVAPTITVKNIKSNVTYLIGGSGTINLTAENIQSASMNSLTPPEITSYPQSRPSGNTLQIGALYMENGKPIWYKGKENNVDVWVDATGATV